MCPRESCNQLRKSGKQEMSDENNDASGDPNKPPREADSDPANVHDRWSDLLGDGADSFQRAVADLEETLKPLQKRMKDFSIAEGIDSPLGQISKDIADQTSAIDKLAQRGEDLPPLPYPAHLNNPIIEANEKLGRIEQRFDQMQDIAVNAAKIATQLQSVALEFVQRFERAAGDNDRAAGKAIKIGIGAVLIAVLMPTAQIIYSELRLEPSFQPETAAALENMQTEIKSLRESQAAATERLDDALASSDKETAAVLREIHQLLSQAKEQPPVELPQAQGQ